LNAHVAQSRAPEYDTRRLVVFGTAYVVKLVPGAPFEVLKRLWLLNRFLLNPDFLNSIRGSAKHEIILA